MTTVTSRNMGRVKWFNTKSGFGFITVLSGSNVGEDIFVHHSAVTVSNEQYKYLIQGEYVEFDLEAATGDTHKFQATKVRGICGGILMCETRHEFRQTRNAYKGDEEGNITNSEPGFSVSSSNIEQPWKLAKQATRDVETHIRSVSNSASANAGRGRGRPRKVTSTVEL